LSEGACGVGFGPLWAAKYHLVRSYFGPRTKLELVLLSHQRYRLYSLAGLKCDLAGVAAIASQIAIA
jgi:hypothetical protein